MTSVSAISLSCEFLFKKFVYLLGISLTAGSFHDLTYKEFEKLLSKRATAPIKSWIMDPNIIAGIGNIYSDEILFFAKVRPTRAVKSLKPKEKMQLYKGVKVVLTNAIGHHGSSVFEFVRPNGDWGTYGHLHKVYGRSGEKCKVCGTIITSLKFSGRTGSFCPKCQK